MQQKVHYATRILKMLGVFSNCWRYLWLTELVFMVCMHIVIRTCGISMCICVYDLHKLFDKGDFDINIDCFSICF